MAATSMTVEQRHPKVTAGMVCCGWRHLGLLAAVLMVSSVQAAVLPEERTDAMYHYYEGGDVTVQGPALLVRKNVGESVSVSGRYYVDTISSASPDVVSGGSPYKDRREEFGVGVDVLHGNSLLSAFVSSSTENDYLADTYSLNVSHELFGGLTTFNMGFSQGHDVVERVDTSLQAGVNRYNFRLGVSQVINKSLLMGLDYEGIAEQGYLKNPYRSARILGAYTEEIYPDTRDSQALTVRLVQGLPGSKLPVSSSIRADYRYTQDNWGIHSHTVGLAYQRYFGDRWLGEIHSRYYQQTGASFYSDNFQTAMTYMARDKELSTFHDYSFGIKWSWRFLDRSLLFFDRVSLNYAHDYVYFSYDDYTNVNTGQLYSFGANILQLYISAWY